MLPGRDQRQVCSFDSWFAFDMLISEILEIGYGVICRLKRNQTSLPLSGKTMTLRELWRKVARDQLRWIGFWQIKVAIVDVELPQAGKVSVVFVQWSKKNWHAFLCTEPERQIVCQ